MAKHEPVKIKKGDTVVVLTGKNSGKQGKIIKVMHKKERVLVERVNMIKRHQKPTAKTQGGIVEKEAGINISNIAIYCPKCSKGTSVGVKFHENGEKVRVCRKCGEELGK